jgi:hypothetical protein
MPKLTSPLSWQDETADIVVANNNGTVNVFVFMSDMHYQTDDGTGTLLRNGSSWSKI